MKQNNSVEYKKSLEDELDLGLLDQIHKVVLQTAMFCFRTKQICLTLDFAIIGLLIKFTANQLDRSIFVAGILIPFGFWFLDAIGYFYQVKLRGVMDEIRTRLMERNSAQFVLPPGSGAIEEERINITQILKIKDAFFNHSMWLYGILVIIDIILWQMYKSGVIS